MSTSACLIFEGRAAGQPFQQYLAVKSWLCGSVAALAFIIALWASMMTPFISKTATDVIYCLTVIYHISNVDLNLQHTIFLVYIILMSTTTVWIHNCYFWLQNRREKKRNVYLHIHWFTAKVCGFYICSLPCIILFWILSSPA